MKHGRIIQITQDDAKLGILLSNLVRLLLRPDHGSYQMMSANFEIRVTNAKANGRPTRANEYGKNQTRREKRLCEICKLTVFPFRMFLVQGIEGVATYVSCDSCPRLELEGIISKFHPVGLVHKHFDRHNGCTNSDYVTVKLCSSRRSYQESRLFGGIKFVLQHSNIKLLEA